MVKERPILFSGPMVRAILAGHKTQTRRVCRDVPCQWSGHVAELSPGLWRFSPTAELGQFHDIACPFGAPGDRLWVRETWQMVDESGEADHSSSLAGRLGSTAPFKGCQGDRQITWRAVYRADGEASHLQYGPIVWKPSIFMPRWASRLTLEVVSVRVERLQAISRADAAAEGMCYLAEQNHPGIVPSNWPEQNFAAGWDGINGKRAPWASNPWVWVVEFRVVA